MDTTQDPKPGVGPESPLYPLRPGDIISFEHKALLRKSHGTPEDMEPFHRWSIVTDAQPSEIVAGMIIGRVECGSLSGPFIPQERRTGNLLAFTVVTLTHPVNGNSQVCQGLICVEDVKAIHFRRNPNP